MASDTDRSPQENKAKADRIRYESPKLAKFGSLSQLIRGSFGSGGDDNGLETAT